MRVRIQPGHMDGAAGDGGARQVGLLLADITSFTRLCEFRGGPGVRAVGSLRLLRASGRQSDDSHIATG